MLPVALTIAGSDPSGGGGIQADLRTFAALGVHGASVVSTLTVQDTRRVRRIVAVAPELVGAQLEAVLDDLPVGAIKTGLLPDAGVVEAIAATLGGQGASPGAARALVVDPVLVASSGDRLAAGGTVEAIKRRLLPLTTLVTPNLDEASALTGRPVESVAAMRDAARALIDLGVGAALIKGGHLRGASAIDVYRDGRGDEILESVRLDVPAVRGTGCVLSAAIAAGLARGRPLPDAVGDAKRLVHRAIGRAVALGHGAGIMHHIDDDLVE